MVCSRIAKRSAMTKLEQAFEEASKLPKDEQEILGKWILQELVAERQWRRSFDAASDRLSTLADEALDEFESGRTEELDPDKL
jgi:hypothetical protein